MHHRIGGVSFWRNGCYCNEYKLTVMQFHACVEKPTEHYLHTALYGFKLHTKTHQHITRLFLHLATKFFSERTLKYIPLYASLQYLKSCTSNVRISPGIHNYGKTEKRTHKNISVESSDIAPSSADHGKLFWEMKHTICHGIPSIWTRTTTGPLGKPNINHTNGQKIQIDTYNLHQLLQCFPHNPGTLFK